MRVLRTCIMKPGMMRWKGLPLKCSGLPRAPMPFSPVQRALKLATVRGTALPNSPMATLPSTCSPTCTSKNTLHTQRAQALTHEACACGLVHVDAGVYRCALCVHGVLHVCPVCARCSARVPCVCTEFCMCALCVHGVLHVCPVYTRLAVGLMCNRSPQNGAPMRMARCLAMRFEESAQLPGQHMCKLPWPVLGCQVSRCVGATHLSVTVRSALSDSSRASQLL